MHPEDWSREPNIDRLERAVRTLQRYPADAQVMFEDLAKSGSPLSMLYIGYIYRDGIGRVADIDEAERWFRKAADAGSVEGYYSLGSLCGRSKRWREAREAFAIAGAKDHGPALHRLGRIYWAGWGVEKDLGRAKRYLERASQAGHLGGRIGLAVLLMRDASSWTTKVRGLALYVSSSLLVICTLFREGEGSDRLR
jgi:TPR repeat protein